MTPLSSSSFALVIVGAIKWLLVGLLRFNFVSAIIGDMSVLSSIVYVLVGLAGIYCISLLAGEPSPSGVRTR